MWFSYEVAISEQQLQEIHEVTCPSYVCLKKHSSSLADMHTYILYYAAAVLS